MRFFIIVLVVGSSIIFILYQILQFFFSISNPKSRVSKDRKFGLIKLRENVDILAPFDIEEFSLLSTLRSASPQRKPFHTEETGTLNTIYHEPLIAYFLFDYLDGRRLLLTEHSGYDIEFYMEQDSTSVWKNGKLTYAIDPSGNMTTIGSPEIIASIKHQLSDRYETITINQSVRAHLLNNQSIDTVNPRAFPVIEPLHNQDLELCFVLTMYSIFLRVK